MLLEVYGTHSLIYCMEETIDYVTGDEILANHVLVLGLSSHVNYIMGFGYSKMRDSL